MLSAVAVGSLNLQIINCSTTDINLELLLNVSDSWLCKWLDFLVFSDKDEKL